MILEVINSICKDKNNNKELTEDFNQVSLSDLENKIDQMKQKALEYADYCWFGGYKIDDKYFAQIKDIDIENNIIKLSLDDSASQDFKFSNILANLNKTPSSANPEALKAYVSNESNISELYKRLLALESAWREFNKAKAVIDELAIAAAEDAPGKPALYNYYKGDRRASAQLVARFNKRVNGNYSSPDAVKEFRDAYVDAYETQLDKVTGEKKQKAENNRRSKDAILNSYNGDIDELIAWLKANVKEILIISPELTDDDEVFMANWWETHTKAPTKGTAFAKKASIDGLAETLDKLEKEGKILPTFNLRKNPSAIYNSWELRLKRDAKYTMPEEVKTWTYNKKIPGDLDTYTQSNVYIEGMTSGKINSTPIVKDLVFNYDFKLGKY